MADDGKVIINIDSNAKTAKKEFAELDNQTKKYEKTLKELKTNGFDGTEKTLRSLKSEMQQMALSGQQGSDLFKKYAREAKILQTQLNTAKSAVSNAIDNNDISSYLKPSQAIKEISAELKNTKNSASEASNGLNIFGTSLSSLGRLAGVASVGFATLKLKDLGVNAIKTAAEFERLNISFRTMTGSTQIGDQLTKELTKLAKVTPMTSQQLAKNAQLLLSFGESAENVIPDLKLLGDISGGNVDKFNSLALAYAQVGSNGKLMGQDLIQMVNAGFNPLQIISEKTGKSIGTLRKEMEQGRISFDKVKKAMIDATSEGGRYYGLMKQQSQSLDGLLSTNADTWQLVAKNIGDFFLPAAKEAIKALTAIGNKVAELQDKMSKSLARNDIKALNFALNHQQEMLSKARTQSERKEWEKKIAQTKGYIDVQNKILNTDKKLDLLSGNSKTGFGSISGSDGPNTEKAKGSYALLQDAANKAQEHLRNLATQGITSGKIWDLQVQKVNNLSLALDKVKQATDLTILPPFQALNKEIQNAQEKVNDLAAAKVVNLDNLKLAKNELALLENKMFRIQQAVSNSPYQTKQNALNRVNSQYLDYAIQGQGNSEAAIQLKNLAKQYQNELTKAQNSLQNSIGVSWSNISNNISSQLSTALTTPLQEGENAFERLGNVALNVIQQISQAWLTSALSNVFSGGLNFGSKTSSLFGNIFGKLFKNANGNVFANGKVIPFANGGVVSSPSIFPMSGKYTGLMGEKGAEAIMPLKRTSNGKLGVQAQTSPANVNIYNQSGRNIEAVQRPNGDTDIFIKKVNNALRSERTQAGFSSALQRNQSRGVQAS